MARTKTGAKRPKIDLATAQVADGALRPQRTVYEMVGIKNVSYREQSYAAYQEQLRKWDLVQLHDHAYEVGVVPSPSRDAMIDRLERKYLQENPQQRADYLAGRAKSEREPEQMTLRERALQIVARGR